LGTTATITSADGGRFALPTARATRRLPVSYQGADRVRTELRGAGQASRQVNNYALNNDVETDHLLVCEVLTPGGNWSSYPPTSTTSTPRTSASSRRSTSSTSAPVPTARRASPFTAPTARRAGRSTSPPRCVPVTSCSP